MTDDFRPNHEPNHEPDPARDPDSPDFTPSSDALRAALSAHASAVEFAPMDPAELRLRAGIRDAAVGGTGAQSAARDADSGVLGASGALLSPEDDAEPGGKVIPLRPKRRWFPALAAAVALVIAVPQGVIVLQRLASGPMGYASAASGAAAGNEGATRAAGPVAPSPASRQDAGAGAQGPASALPAGYRYESFLDVRVVVPTSWGYGVAVGADWCARGRLSAKASGPFVALDPMEQGVDLILCDGDIPEADQTEHLEWKRATASSIGGERTANGWVYSSAVVGSALITYVHRPGVDAGVLASAVQVDVDHNGCSVAAPAGLRPTGPSTAAPTSAVLCEYLDQPDVSGAPSLVTSKALDASAAAALLDDIEAGEVVAGKLPDASCMATPDATPAVVIKLSSAAGIREVWLSGGCGVPTFDDGAVVRRATRAACASMYEPPLARGAWSSASAVVCQP